MYTIPLQKFIAKQKGIVFKDITESPLKSKKYRITLPDGSKIDYGAKGHSDYLLHHDDARRERFHKRFKNNPGYNSKQSPLYYSSRLLW